MNEGPELSVVIPAMNEEDNIQAMHDRLIAALEDRGRWSGDRLDR